MLSDFKVKLSELFFMHRWHPEVALRYLPITKAIKSRRGKPIILEVGSGGLGIVPYLKRKVTGVDVDFSPPYHKLLKRVKGSALSLPFKDLSFDIVICIDMLEHLQGKTREKAILEMMRVAKHLVIIAVPCGRLASLQDKKLSDIYNKKFGKVYQFFEEQLEFGLPTKNQLIKAIRKAAKKLDRKIDLKIEGNENLKLREFLMKGWMTESLLIDVFFRKIMLLAVFIMALFNQEPNYRKIFYITKL